MSLGFWGVQLVVEELIEVYFGVVGSIQRVLVVRFFKVRNVFFNLVVDNMEYNINDQSIVVNNINDQSILLKSIQVITS